MSRSNSYRCRGSHDREGTVRQAMQQPVSVSLGLTADTACVAYRLLRSGKRVAYTRHVNDVVRAAFDVGLLVLGIPFTSIRQ